MEISKIFALMVEHRASDLYLRTNAIPRVRVDGHVQNLMEERLTKEEMLAITNLLLGNENRRRDFIENNDVDFIHEEPVIGRFRINIFMQRQTPALVARHVHSQTKSFEELNLPVELCKLFAEEKKGLFIVTGPAGNGKSTTIASMIEYINTISTQHIITIEDPIE